MSLKILVFREGRGKWEKGAYIYFLRSHRIGTADSFIEHLTDILFWSQNNLTNKWAEKNPAASIWYKTFQRQLYIEYETSLNCFFLYQLSLVQTDFSSTTVMLADLSRELGMMLCLLQPGQEATLLSLYPWFIKPTFWLLKSPYFLLYKISITASDWIHLNPPWFPFCIYLILKILFLGKCAAPNINK